MDGGYKKMHQWIKRFIRRPTEDPESKQMIEQLREVRRQLAGLQSYFALETDEDLLEAAIYQKEALEMRERHLIKQAREQNMVAQELPIETEKRERWIH
jgi:hypothetical protein